MAYTIKLPVFEGPFDLLLHLVKINEMDIYDIPIAEITRQYLDYLHVMQELDLEVAGEFLVMAATLIHLKARTLLPAPPEPEEQEEELGAIMSARELMRQLVEYRKYKEAAAALREREEAAARVLYRIASVEVVPERTKELSLDVSLLYRAFARVLRYVDVQPYRPDLVEQFTVEEKIQYIEDLLRRESEIDLTKLFGRCLNKLEIITTFMAVLELTRLRRIRIVQENPFDTIRILRGPEQIEYEFSEPRHDDNAES
ncbi:MAG: segregation/condensation protein A [Candidatus Hydrogenedentota bacterium]|uniref:Segregation and condensation protein A n=1 Tax=Sumerlaea chitinivorans TaxID=2250252 RepID=A0A2Z4Y3R6_SUMC1|nr:Segregation and condensation protein A [Candidatus Sumerlaea chitinivorans]RMH24098.1 MAG: segregation/condensation protein A [Candidatus Hydrogenedentota bacterium]